MLQSFFTDTVESKFIKELLYKTPLPLLHTKSSGDYVVEGFFYIYDGNIIKCTKSGALDTIGNTAGYEEIKEFSFGENVPKITERHISKYNYYDTDTHEKLGTYLRCLRDIYGINLMPLYNCFSYKSLAGFCCITEGKDKKVIRKDNQPYKLFGAPIRFNTTYTISLDCPTGALIYPVFYNDLGINQKYLEWYSEKVVVKPNMSFRRLETIEITNDTANKDLESLSNDLYLVIQVPSNNESSILIQEGDYTSLPRLYDNENGETKFSLVYSMEDIDNIPIGTLNKTLLSPISLQTMSTGSSYAFSNRLIEYLLLNAITSNEDIGDNIERVQEKVLPRNYRYWKGVWDNALRCHTYNKYVENVVKNTNKIAQFRDTIGFVDKDVESILDKLPNINE